MRKFIKGRWFPLVAAIGIIAVIAFVMALLGFRLTYAPSLENSWNAVSAVATWVGVVASFIAIWFAIRVPKKIAQQENKIALFEKRYAVYAILKRCVSFSLSIKETHNSSDIHKIFVAIFGCHFVVKNDIDTKQEIQNELPKYAIDTKNVLDTASFLFGYDTDSYTLPIVKKLFDILYQPADPERIREYKAQIQKMEQELLPKIKRELSLLQ